MRFFINLVFLLILALPACSGLGGDSGAKSRYEPPATPGGRMCLSQCRSALEHCTGGCLLEERACVSDVQSQAIKDYEAYVRDQFMARADVELRPRDFERTEACGAKACRKKCERTYDGCFVECGGKIVKDSSCRFLCFD